MTPADQQPVPGLVALADRFGPRDMADAAAYEAAVRRLIRRARRLTSRASVYWHGRRRATPPWSRIVDACLDADAVVLLASAGSR